MGVQRGPEGPLTTGPEYTAGESLKKEAGLVFIHFFKNSGGIYKNKSDNRKRVKIRYRGCYLCVTSIHCIYNSNHIQIRIEIALHKYAVVLTLRPGGGTRPTNG